MVLDIFTCSFFDYLIINYVQLCVVNALKYNLLLIL